MERGNRTNLMSYLPKYSPDIYAMLISSRVAGRVLKFWYEGSETEAEVYVWIGRG